MRVFVLFVGAALIFGAAVEADDHDPIQLCGNRLLQTIRYLCRTFGKVRRSDPSMIAGHENGFEVNSIGDGDYSEGDRDMVHPRVRRDVTMDCCYQPCTIGHIRKNYCPQRRPRTTPTPLQAEPVY